MALALVQILTNLDELSFLTVLAFPKAGERETEASGEPTEKIIPSSNLRQPYYRTGITPANTAHGDSISAHNWVHTYPAETLISC